MINPNDLKAYAKNSRKHSPEQIKRIEKSLTEFGFLNPVLIDKDNTLIAGHARVQAAKNLGLEKIPFLRVEHLTKAQQQAYVIADNRLAELSEWDMDALSSELKELLEVDYDLALTGFEDFKFDEEEALIEEDEVPELPQEPITKLGDVWQLGNHRLMCGDATFLNDIEKLLNGNKVDLLFTDPPYSLETEGGCKGSIGKSLKKQCKNIEFISQFDPKDFLSNITSVFDKNKMNAYIFCNKELLPDYLMFAKNSGYSFNVLVWKKPGAIPIGSSHRPDIEYLLLFRKNAIWNNGIKEANYSRCLEYGREKGLHPTMKPIDLISNELLISSNLKSIVLDLFGGSGSTLIACEQTKRTCYMMEFDPKYCDVIIKRWENLTKKKATLC
jgi:DNA modification methylase